MITSMGNGRPAGRGIPAASAALPFYWLDERLETMDFKDQYKHPNWQKKRLEALESAEFMCQLCYDTESQLHVHHKHYVKGRLIWDYETTELSVLCDACHEVTHDMKDMLGEIVMALCPEGYTELIGIIASYCSEVCGPCSANAYEIVERINNPHAQAIGKVAALITNRFLGVPALFDLADRLAQAKEGESVTIGTPTIEPFIGVFK